MNDLEFSKIPPVVVKFLTDGLRAALRKQEPWAICMVANIGRREGHFVSEFHARRSFSHRYRHGTEYMEEVLL